MPRLMSTMPASSTSSQRLRCSPGWSSLSMPLFECSGCDEADHADDQRAQNCATDAVYSDADRQEGRGPEDDAIDDQREETEGDDGERQGQQQQNRPQERVEHAEHEREQLRRREALHHNQRGEVARQQHRARGNEKPEDKPLHREVSAYPPDMVP